MSGHREAMQARESEIIAIVATHYQRLLIEGPGFVSARSLEDCYQQARDLVDPPARYRGRHERRGDGWGGSPLRGGGEVSYDSRPDTIKHSKRVYELIAPLIRELTTRADAHDLSKTMEPELAIFDEFTPKLRTSTYGSDEYKRFLEAMGEGLEHHYAHNRHHPEHFGENGINGMTLVDLIEMLADWKAATERHEDGSLHRSLVIAVERFGIDGQLDQILFNTAREYGWLDTQEGRD